MTIEVTAKKADDAIKQGLEQLGATYDDVKIEVLETGGLFRKARVRLTLENGQENSPEPASETSAPAESQSAEKEKQPEAAAEKKPEPKTAEKNETKKQNAPAAKKQSEIKNDSVPSDVNECEKSQSTPSAQSKKSENVQNRSGGKNRREKSSRAPQDEAKSECAGETANSETSSEETGAPSAAKAKRRLRAEDREAANHALEFVKETVKLMGFGSATVSADTDVEHIEITADDGDDSLIIGRHGDTLSALTYLAETCARAEKCHVNITVDCNGYRARRAASLTAMAKRRARESAQKHRRIKLEPMDRTDRRTIHCALADDEYVTTASEGKEPYRCIVITPKNGEAYDYEERGTRGGKRGDRRGGKSHDSRANTGGGEKPRRAAFDINIHGFVGHNDSVSDDQPSENAETVTDAKEE